MKRSCVCTVYGRQFEHQPGSFFIVMPSGPKHCNFMLLPSSNLSDERHVFAAIGNFAFRHLIMQIDSALLASHHFVYDYEVAIVYKEYGPTVFSDFVAGFQ